MLNIKTINGNNVNTNLDQNNINNCIQNTRNIINTVNNINNKNPSLIKRQKSYINNFKNSKHIRNNILNNKRVLRVKFNNLLYLLNLESMFLDKEFYLIVDSLNSVNVEDYKDYIYYLDLKLNSLSCAFDVIHYYRDYINIKFDNNLQKICNNFLYLLLNDLININNNKYLVNNNFSNENSSNQNIDNYKLCISILNDNDYYKEYNEFYVNSLKTFKDYVEDCYLDRLNKKDNEIESKYKCIN